MLQYLADNVVMSEISESASKKLSASLREADDAPAAAAAVADEDQGIHAGGAGPAQEPKMAALKKGGGAPKLAGVKIGGPG